MISRVSHDRTGRVIASAVHVSRTQSEGETVVIMPVDAYAQVLC